jgi:membrane-associated phospholipid phosphatase
VRWTKGGAEPIEPLHRGELSVVAVGLFAMVAVLALRVRDTAVPLRFDQLASGIIDSVGVRRTVLDLGVLGPRAVAQPFVAWGTMAIAAAVALTLVVVAGRRRDWWAAALCVVGPALALVLVDLSAKPLVGRYHGRGLTFPSGHATTAAAAATLVVVLLDRWHGWRRALCWAPAAALLPLVAGAGVVRLGWHYPTDVIGGIAFGAAVVVALAAAVPGPRGRTPPPA